MTLVSLHGTSPAAAGISAWALRHRLRAQEAAVLRRAREIDQGR